MRDLAGALGVKRPTLYFYFPDHGAVLDAAAEPADRALAEAVLAASGNVRRAAVHPPPMHPIDRVCAVIEATQACAAERPQLVAALVQRWALGGAPSPVLERMRRALAAARDELIADLRTGIARREVRPCDPEQIIDLVLTCLGGAAMQHALGVPHRDDLGDELVRRVLEPLRIQRKRRRGRT